MDLENMPDGQIKACITEYGITACCYVSSMHLVEEKEKQLRDAIARQLEVRNKRNGSDD